MSAEVEACRLSWISLWVDSGGGAKFFFFFFSVRVAAAETPHAAGEQQLTKLGGGLDDVVQLRKTLTATAPVGWS